MTTKAKILIIDDDADIVEAMRLMLESRGYEITAAYDFDEGVSKVKSIKPDLVVLDVMLMLNQKTGFDLSYEIRKDPGTVHIPILMVTSINELRTGFDFSPETDDEYLPVDEFINKPAQPEELYLKVEKLLKNKNSKWSKWPNKAE